MTGEAEKKQLKRVIDRQLKIFAGSHYSELAEKVAEKLGVKLGKTNLQTFANGEIKCHLDESVRGGDVYIFQSHDRPVGEAIMEQAILIDAAKRASAKHITAVCPFFGYARQDRKSAGREPITAKLVVDIFTVAGADRIVSVDLHTGQIQGFFDGPFDHLVALPVLANYMKKRFGTDFVVVSPDAGRVKLAERYASRLGIDLAIVHKSRTGINKAKALDVIGDIKGRHCVVVDDMIDTAGTICAAADVLKERGAKTISVAVTHGLFSDPAIKRLNESAIENIMVTDTLPRPAGVDSLKNLEVVSIVSLVANAINAIFQDSSVSALFEGENQI